MARWFGDVSEDGILGGRDGRDGDGLDAWYPVCRVHRGLERAIPSRSPLGPFYTSKQAQQLLCANEMYVMLGGFKRTNPAPL